jgi:putative photosynthetic complex assembly protein 2
MGDFALPVLYALFLWWITTGLLLYLHRLPARTYRWSMLGMSLLAVVALYGHLISSAETDLFSAYLAFTCGVILWGWLEIGYFTGILVGPRSEPCPDSAGGWRRFLLAIRTGLFHEVGILVTVVLLAVLAWGAPNQVGTWAFVVLWLMRWSAKLNLFLGVPNLNEHWLPEHMRFLSTYMVRRSMNPLFPVSVTAASVILGLLVQLASAADPGSLQRVGLMLVASLLALGILEHWFLVLPTSEETLWRWALRPAEEGNAGRKAVGGEPESRGGSPGALTPAGEETRAENRSRCGELLPESRAKSCPAR